MKLSIITINYNNRDGLKKTIESVISQTFTDFEWIVIDGGSTDGSKELIEECSSHMSYWVSEPDKGIYNAMNKGIARASGEYLQFLNSGDWLCSNTILSEVFCTEYDSDIVYGNIALYENDAFLKYHKYKDRLSYLYLLNQPLGHNSCFIKRQLLIAYPYDEKLKIVSDWKFVLQAALNNASFSYVDLYIGCFDMTGISSTATDVVQREKEMVMSELCPNLLLEDLNNLERLRPNIGYLDIDNYIKLRSKHKLLSKLANLVIKTMKFIDRL